MEVFENIEMIVALLTGLVGLVGAGITAYFAVKAWIQTFKGKNAQQIWTLIMEVADKAMEEAERTALSGADKKALVINTIKASTEASGLDISDFMTQLDLYIDQTIAFVNKMNKRDTET